jgi:hypothetical protein
MIDGTIQIFCRPSDFPNTVMTWELEGIENNKTRLNLFHTGFKVDEMAKKQNEGWSHFLTELKKYCEKRNKQSWERKKQDRTR